MFDQTTEIANLRSGIPPDDIELIHVNTSNFCDILDSLKKEIQSAKSTKSLRNIYLVSPRGLGKTHILKVIRSQYNEDQDFVVLNVNKPDEPLRLIKSLIKSWKKNNLDSELKNLKSSQKISEGYEVYHHLQKTINYNESFNIAISYIDDPEFGFLAWKWLTDRLGPGEVSSLRYGREKITRNIPDSDAIALLKAFSHFLAESSNKTLILLIDEFTRITDLTPRQIKAFKGFLVDLINESWQNGIFICFATTDHAWKEIEEDEYSVSIGLTRRARKFDLLGLSGVHELEMIFEKILNLFPTENQNEIKVFVSDTNLLERLYTNFQRNPGEIIRNLIEHIDQYLEQVTVSKNDTLTREEIIRIIREE